MLAYLRITVVLLLICGGIYPALVVLIGGGLFPYQAQGSLITLNGQPVGSALIGQAFDKPIYFQPRPSAAGTDGYDATTSGGSNLGPTNKALIDSVQSRAQAYRAGNGLASNAIVPADAVTASGSGLDPNISPENAMDQVARVAKARSVPEAKVAALVQSHIQGRDLGIFGDPKVNVLELNLALDQQMPAPASASATGR